MSSYLTKGEFTSIIIVKVPTYNGVKITIGDLATYTSGLPDTPPNFPKNDNFAYTYTPSKLYQGLSNTILMSQPGTKYSYSNFGYGLLGYILSLRSGIPYEHLLANRVLNILALDSTKITLPDALKSRLAAGHLHGIELKPHIFPEVGEPAGGLLSSTNDLLRYLGANMGLIHTKLDAVMQQTQVIRHVTVPEVGPRHDYVGLAWFIVVNGTERVINHNGAVPAAGYSSFIGFNPTKHLGVVVLCSCTDIPGNVLTATAMSFLRHE